MGTQFLSSFQADDLPKPTYGGALSAVGDRLFYIGGIARIDGATVELGWIFTMKTFLLRFPFIFY